MTNQEELILSLYNEGKSIRQIEKSPGVILKKSSIHRIIQRHQYELENEQTEEEEQEPARENTVDGNKQNDDDGFSWWWLIILVPVGLFFIWLIFFAKRKGTV